VIHTEHPREQKLAGRSNCNVILSDELCHPRAQQQAPQPPLLLKANCIIPPREDEPLNVGGETTFHVKELGATISSQKISRVDGGRRVWHGDTLGNDWFGAHRQLI